VGKKIYIRGLIFRDSGGSGGDKEMYQMSHNNMRIEKSSQKLEKGGFTSNKFVQTINHCKF
jgi:hypothetical protein